GPIYVKVGEAVKDESWHPSSRVYGMKEDCMKLAPFGVAVPKKVQEEALALQEKIKQGKFEVFQAPLKDRDGVLRLSVGQKVDATWLGNMNWLAPGVGGSLAKAK